MSTFLSLEARHCSSWNEGRKVQLACDGIERKSARETLCEFLSSHRTTCATQTTLAFASNCSKDSRVTRKWFPFATRFHHNVHVHMLLKHTACQPSLVDLVQETKLLDSPTTNYFVCRACRSIALKARSHQGKKEKTVQKTEKT